MPLVCWCCCMRTLARLIELAVFAALAVGLVSALAMSGAPRDGIIISGADETVYVTPVVEGELVEVVIRPRFYLRHAEQMQVVVLRYPAGLIDESTMYLPVVFRQ